MLDGLAPDTDAQPANPENPRFAEGWTQAVNNFKRVGFPWTDRAPNFVCLGILSCVDSKKCRRWSLTLFIPWSRIRKYPISMSL